MTGAINPATSVMPKLFALSYPIRGGIASWENIDNWKE